IRVRHHFQKSSFVQDITMYAGVPRVDVHMQADWHEQHILLKVAFPVSARSDHATYEIPYGSVERPTTRNTPAEQAQFEVPALRWADMSDAIHGFSLLNDSKYGYDAKDNVLVTAVKKAADDNALIVRFYEWAGKKGDVVLQLPQAATQASETNLMEVVQTLLSLDSTGTVLTI